jgi:hypothetical protein
MRKLHCGTIDRVQGRLWAGQVEPANAATAKFSNIAVGSLGSELPNANAAYPCFWAEQDQPLATNAKLLILRRPCRTRDIRASAGDACVGRREFGLRAQTTGCCTSYEWLLRSRLHRTSERTAATVLTICRSLQSMQDQRRKLLPSSICIKYFIN